MSTKKASEPNETGRYRSFIIFTGSDVKLFHRVIMLSGSALASWSLSSDPIGQTQALATHVNCSEHLRNSEHLLRVSVDGLEGDVHFVRGNFI